MRKLFAAAVAFAVVMAAAARADDAEARKVIEKAIKAHGGVETLTKNKGKSVIQKGKISVHNPIEIEGTMETFSGNKKFKRVMQLTVMGMEVTQIVCYDGKELWVSAMGMIVMSLKDKELDPVKESIYAEEVAGLVLLNSKGLELSLIGDDKVNDKPVVGVKVSQKDHKDVSLFFDKESGLLTKIENRGLDLQTKQEVSQSRIMSAYKEIDGQKRPTKVTILQDGKKTADVEITETKFVDKLDDNTFDKP